jgi:hypothetical protein
MRKQYHFRPGASGLDAWDVGRLLRLVENEPLEELPLAQISEVDSDYWFDHGYAPTVRNVVEHCRLIADVDMSYPIVIDPEGRVMDGMHRVARALLDGQTSIPAKRLSQLPEPDFTDCRPGDLPY